VYSHQPCAWKLLLALLGGSDSAYCYTLYRSVVCLSACLFVTLMPLLKPFDGSRCHLAGTLVESNDTLCYMGDPDLQGEGRFVGRTPSPNKLLQIAAKPSVLCCHLANTNDELGKLATAIPPFAKLLWSLFPSNKPRCRRAMCWHIMRPSICTHHVLAIRMIHSCTRLT